MSANLTPEVERLNQYYEEQYANFLGVASPPKKLMDFHARVNAMANRAGISQLAPQTMLCVVLASGVEIPNLPGSARKSLPPTAPTGK